MQYFSWFAFCIVTMLMTYMFIVLIKEDCYLKINVVNLLLYYI